MSADDTVIVLKTAGRRTNDNPEYRVAWCQAMENIYDRPNYPSTEKPVLNREWTLRIFKGATVYGSVEKAMERARDLNKDPAEYGIKSIDHSSIHFPASDGKRRRRERQRARQCELNRQRSN